MAKVKFVPNLKKGSLAAKHLEYLQFLSNCTPKKRAQLIKLADRDEIDAICECALNLRNAKLSPAQMLRLNKHSSTLKHLIGARKSLASKKKVLQKGNGLPMLLAAAIPALLSLFGK